MGYEFSGRIYLLVRNLQRWPTASMHIEQARGSDLVLQQAQSYIGWVSLGLCRERQWVELRELWAGCSNSVGLSLCNPGS